jgi:hypothetical protein
MAKKLTTKTQRNRRKTARLRAKLKRKDKKRVARMAKQKRP